MGSCMGPLMFVVYASELFDIIQSDLPEAHWSADDTRLYLSLKPGDANAQDVAAAAMEYCPSLSSLHLPQNNINFPELFQSLSIVQVGGRRKRQVFSKPLHCTQNLQEVINTASPSQRLWSRIVSYWCRGLRLFRGMLFLLLQ